MGLRDAEAKAFGFPGLRFVTIPHPYGQLPEAEALAIATRAGQEVLEMLSRVPQERVRA